MQDEWSRVFNGIQRRKPAKNPELNRRIPMDLLVWKELITRWIELVGVAVILIGTILSTMRFVIRWASTELNVAYREYRQQLGRAILLGLEFLVAGDIINTVAVDPTFRSVGVLAGIVVIRTFLSFSLEVEIEGRWPWARAESRQV